MLVIGFRCGVSVGSSICLLTCCFCRFGLFSSLLCGRVGSGVVMSVASGRRVGRLVVVVVVHLVGWLGTAAGWSRDDIPSS